jgi:hypothetical protein
MEAPVQEFLASRRIALGGFSRKPKDFSRMLDARFRERGYVRVIAVEPSVQAALVIVPPSLAESVVRDCLDAGMRRIWSHRLHGWFRTRGRQPGR